MSAAADPLASDVAWAPEELGEALQALAEAAGLRHAAARLGGPSPTRPPNAWIEAAARRIGLEAEPVATPCTELATLLRRGAPALVALPPRGAAAPPTSTGGFGEADDPRGARYLALVSATRRHVLVVGPDRATRRLPLEVVRQRLAERNEASGRREVERLASGLGLNDRQSRRAVEALLRRRLADVDVGGIWLVRDPAGGFEGAGRRLVELVGSHVAELACMLAAWTLLGWMTATGRFDSGWMTAWGLLIALCVPFRWLTQTIVGRWLLEFGAAARRRLLTGALGLDPDRVRADGTGGLMGRVLEVESLEQLALGGGITGALAALEILLAAGILGWFAGQPGLVAWLAVTVAAASGLGWLAFRRRVA